MGEAGPARGVDEAAEGAEAPRRRRRTRHRRSALRRWFRRYGRHLWIYAVAVFLSISVTYYLVR